MRSTDPQRLVLHTNDLPRGYAYGDDTGCGPTSASEGDWPALRPLFATERPVACIIQLEWRWQGEPPYPRGVTSAAYRFRNEAGARSAFAARDELALFTASLDGKSREELRLGDEAELLRGRGLNSPASGAVWRDGNVVAVLVVEPADDDAARKLAQRQDELMLRPSPRPKEQGADPELQLDDPSLKLPVYWLGASFAPTQALPPLQLAGANVGGSGPGQGVQLEYSSSGRAGGVTLDVWEPMAWARFRRTRLGRLIWDSPCARKEVIPVTGGRAEIFDGYGTPVPVSRPCPKQPRNRSVAHVYYPGAVVVVNMPYCYACASPAGKRGPYDTVDGLEVVVRSLRLRAGRG